MEQQVGVLVKHRGPTVVGVQVQHNIVLVLSLLEEACYRQWLAAKLWRKVADLLGILEGNNLQGNRLVYMVAKKKLGEHGAHHLELQCDFASAVLAAVSENGDVGRTDVYPSFFRPSRSPPTRQNTRPHH